MPGCVLRVAGDDFEPDRVLPQLTLQPYMVWHRGEPVYPSKPTGRRNLHSGFACNVSEIDGSMRAQLVDAEAFLYRHRADFEILKSIPAAGSPVLDFGVWSRLGKVAVQGEYLPVSFLELVGSLRVAVAITIYPGS